MKNIILSVGLFSLFLVTEGFGQSGNNQASDIFVGSSPCGNIVRTLFGMPKDEACEYIKWKIVFTSDTFLLSGLYGVSKPNTSTFEGGGKPIEMKGKWIIVKGIKANPEAVVYQLTTANGGTIFSFVKMDNNVIHLLDSKRNLMIGNEGYSYTFSRVKP